MTLRFIGAQVNSALITGGDSGIGRAVAILFAREGADVAIVYLKQDERDAEVTKKGVEAEGRKCVLIEGDARARPSARRRLQRTLKQSIYS
jgi:NAD(P)-dependent dehydrogenase (short-subunit alcohol dehydrogenase family)